MNITFRKLTCRDISLALGMNETFRPGFLSPEGASKFLGDEHNWLFAAIHESTVIGFAYGYQLQRLDGAEMLYIHEVGIANDFQGQGIGTALMNALKATCTRHGIIRFFLFTDQKNAGANALYQKCGGETGYDSHGNDTAYYFPISTSKPR